VLHLHDRDWVFVPAGDKQFRRTEVKGGRILSDGKQEILSGIAVGQQVVPNALELESTVSQ
jgi:cobalt-zinc-cadmium efflux system membrane fusion protein